MTFVRNLHFHDTVDKLYYSTLIHSFSNYGMPLSGYFEVDINQRNF